MLLVYVLFVTQCSSSLFSGAAVFFEMVACCCDDNEIVAYCVSNRNDITKNLFCYMCQICWAVVKWLNVNVSNKLFFVALIFVIVAVFWGESLYCSLSGGQKVCKFPLLVACRIDLSVCSTGLPLLSSFPFLYFTFFYSDNRLVNFTEHLISLPENKCWE